MKNIYKTLSLLIIFSFSQNLRAQNNVQVVWGPELKNDSKAMLDHIIGENSSSFYALRLRPQSIFSDSHIYIEEYSKTDMNLVHTQELLMPNTDGKKVKFESLFYLKGKMILFTSYYNSSEDKNYAFVQYINDDGTVNPNYKKVDEITATKKRNAGSFDFVLSTDSSKILVYHSEAYEKNANQKFNYKVLDANLNETWSKSLELPYRDKNFSVSDYTVDNNGDVYMLAKIELEKEERVKGNPNYKYEIVYYNHTADALKEYDLSIGQKFITSVHFKLNASGDLVCAGFYSDKDSYSVIGSFYLKIDEKTKNVISTGFQAFDKNLLAQFMSVRKVNKGKEINNMKADKILFHDDGTAYLIGEQYWVEVVTNYDPNTHSVTYTYVYNANNIVVVNFAADGSVVWTKCIVKNQESANDNGMYLSYSEQEVGKKIFFMFNDNAKNLTIPDPNDYKTMTNAKKSVAMLITLDASGDIQRTPMFNSKDLEVILRPLMSVEVNHQNMIIYGERRKAYKFGRVAFQ